jgi:hypothetical protein
MNLLQSNTYTDSGSGWVNVNIPATWVNAPYVWLAASSSTTLDVYLSTCQSCGVTAALGNGQIPATWSSAYTGNYPLAADLSVLWSCP